MKMSTYPVSGVTRESISLDEDELSDVEDEVFIRDGRNGFKFAEDRGVKRPLMAPRRKLGKPDLASRLKNRPPCRVMCVPCCYAFAALSLFLGLIMLVIILVSLFPLPLDKLRFWFSSKSSSTEKVEKVLPCIDLNVTEIWTYSMPKLTSESTMRALDVNLDGVDDIVFGFGIGEDVFLPEQWFCPMFLGVQPPCQGGIIALDGITGQPIWQRWLHHAVMTIYCTADLTGDGIPDCVISGKGGILCAVNGHDGNVIWQFTNNKTSPIVGIYAGSIIPDQDGDNVNDIVASHTIQKGQSRLGFLLIISGKTGAELVRVSTPQSVETYFAPQLFTRINGERSVLFGTGGPNSPGSLFMVGLHDISIKNVNPYTIYTDTKKGIISPVILIDITGDKIEDIVAAMYNSTIVAFDGITFKQLWNFTVPNAETKSVPTPGYFNADNVTDFLVKYQVGQGFPVYYFSETYIIDGTNGKPIYTSPIIDTGGEQLHGLTISMENFGNDMYLFWKADCKNNEQKKETFDFIPGSNYWQKTLADLCKLRFNTTKDVKLYALNQYQEPPGLLLYTSDNSGVIEYNNSRLPLEDVRQYLKDNPSFDSLFKNPNPNPTPIVDDSVSFKPLYNQRMRNMKINKGGSSFRHRDDGQTLIKDFSHTTNQNIRDEPGDPLQLNNGEQEMEEKYEYDQPEWNQNPIDIEGSMLDPGLDYDQYSDVDRDGLLGRKRILSSNILTNPRDPRSKSNPVNLTDYQDYEDSLENTNQNKASIKKNLARDLEALTPNDYKNVYAARNRLLHDLNDVPNEILRQTFQKNKALRQALRSTRDEKNENEKEIEKKETKNVELPETLWDLESEKELEDKENGYYRGKRETIREKIHGIPKMTSTGILLKPLVVSKHKDSIDYVFATYWLLPKEGAQVLLEEDAECIRQKMLNSASSKDNYQNLEKSTLQDLFTKMCLEERGIMLKPEIKNDPINDDLKQSPYYNQISQLTLGQMTVYRIRLQCKCEIMKPNERCAQILDDQTWSSYLGKLGDGYFRTR